MIVLRFYVLVFFVTIKQTNQAECNEDVCLSWTLLEQRLKLECYISQPYNMVYIVNQEGRIIGDCLPSNPTECSAYPTFAKFYYDFATATFIFTLKVMTDTKITGIWKCTHGRNGEAAEVFINTLSITTENSQRTYEEQKSQWMSFEVSDKWTQAQDLVTKYLDTKNEESYTIVHFVDDLKRYAIPIGMVIILVIILAVVVKIVINLKRLSPSNSNNTANSQDMFHLNRNINHTPSQGSVHDQVHEAEHDYISVIEDEMIPDEIILEIQPNEEDYYSDKTSANTSTDTDNPYLDVIHDSPVLNEYEQADTVNANEVHHDYTTISNNAQSNRIYINELI